jgi:hypothetical protein
LGPLPSSYTQSFNRHEKEIIGLWEICVYYELEETIISWKRPWALGFHCGTRITKIIGVDGRITIDISQMKTNGSFICGEMELPSNYSGADGMYK